MNDRPRGGQHLPAGAVALNRDAVLLDELGASALVTSPARELGLVMDLGGRLNRTPARVQHRYLLSVPQAAELCASVIVAALAAGEDFDAQLGLAIGLEKDRIRREGGD